MPSLDDIASNRTSGAAEIKEMSIEYLLEKTGEIRSDTQPRDAIALIADAARKLVSARPSMAPVFNLANGLLLAVEKVGVGGAVDTADVVEAARDFLLRERGRTERMVGGVVGNALGVLGGMEKFVVLSWSSTVNAAMVELAKKRTGGEREDGKPLEVFVLESRPAMEGRQTALFLAKNGIRVTYLCDALMGTAVENSDAVVLGADAVTIHGVVNKTGSFPISLAARHLGKPLYALTSTDKFYPASMGDIKIADRDPDEVWEKPPAGVRVLNRYFEKVPLDLLTAIITERGPLDEKETLAFLKKMPVSSLLL